MNFNTPHRQYGRAGGQASCDQTFRMSFPTCSKGMIKTCLTSLAPRLLSHHSALAAQGIGFLSHLFGLISPPSLQAKVNFMAGQEVFMLLGGNRCCGQPSRSSLETGQWQQNMNHKLSKVNGPPPEEPHSIDATQFFTAPSWYRLRQHTNELPSPVGSVIVQTAENGHSDSFTPKCQFSHHVRCFYSARAQFLKTKKCTRSNIRNQDLKKKRSDEAFQASSDIIPTATASPKNVWTTGSVCH